MKTFSLILGLVAISMLSIGCNPDPDSPANPGPKTDIDPHAGHNHGDDGDDHDDHDHAAQDHSPKHGGHMVEIGRNHEYHAELVDDHQSGTVTVYMTDSHMEPLTLNESSISLVLTSGEVTKTFELLATQPGGSVSFSSNDAEMMKLIDGEGVKGKIRVQIDGKPFNGAFDHHDHDHGDDGDSHEGHNH